MNSKTRRNLEMKQDLTINKPKTLVDTLRMVGQYNDVPGWEDTRYEEQKHESRHFQEIIRSYEPDELLDEGMTRKNRIEGLNSQDPPINQHDGRRKRQNYEVESSHKNKDEDSSFEIINPKEEEDDEINRRKKEAIIKIARSLNGRQNKDMNT